MGNHTVDVGLRIDGADVAPRALDRLTSVLSDDLRAARVGTVGRPSAGGAPGAKSGLVPLVGELTVTGVASTGVWLLHRTIVAFLDRSKARSVTVKLGATEIEVTSATKDEVARALEAAVQHALDNSSGAAGAAADE